MVGDKQQKQNSKILIATLVWTKADQFRTLGQLLKHFTQTNIVEMNRQTNIVTYRAAIAPRSVTFKHLPQVFSFEGLTHLSLLKSLPYVKSLPCPWLLYLLYMLYFSEK